MTVVVVADVGGRRYRDLMDIEQVRAEMERRFAAMDPQPWPPPREPMDSPRQEEYSRVTDPARYRIVGQRATAWAEAAVALLGATYEAVPIPEGDDAPTSWRAPLASSWRLASPRPGTIPLYVHATASPQAAGMLSGVLVAIGRPGFDLELVPDCGCDACDWGSDGLLEQVDELIAAVLAGDLRAAKGADRQHEWRTLDLPGHSSSGTSRSRDWRRRPWSERWEGAPWL